MYGKMTKKQTESEQEDLFQAETTWFHVFKDMIKSRDMAKIDGSAIKVYLVIKAYTNFATGMAFPSISLIAEEAGLSERHVVRCLSELEKFGYISKSKSGRQNIYSLREKVSIKDADGRPQAVATWDYIPNGVKDAMAELKHAVITGEMVGGKIINIEHLVLNLNVQTGNGATQVILNDIEKLPPEMQEKLISLKSKLRKKPTNR